jgi:hypothetical protein
MPGLLLCDLARSWGDVVRPCRVGGADMALRRPAFGAGRLSIRRIPLPLYKKLGSQICSISVSCGPSDGKQARRAVRSESGSDGSRLAKRIVRFDRCRYK